MLFTHFGFMRRIGSVALLSAIVACAPTAPSTPGGSTQADPGKPVRGGTIVDSQTSDAAFIQPVICTNSACSNYEALHYYAPMLTRDPDTLEFSTKYGTAESYQYSQDGFEITFKLKPNLVWSDGKPITAHDYKFTYDTKLDPKTDFAAKANYRQIEGARVVDDRTIVFRLKELYCPAINQLTFNPVPKHIFENLNINDNPENQKPTVGSGPWLLKEWVKDSHATFVANERFFLGRPNIDTYTYRIVKDQTIQYSMFKSGDLDVVGLRAEDFEEAKALPHANTFRYFPPSARWDYIGMNMRGEILKDVKVRQAFAHAINRQQIIDRIRLGFAKPINSIYASANWAFTDDVPKFNYDPNRSKQLLDEAGWRAPSGDPNGTRVKDGKPLKMRIFYNSGNKDRESIATVSQQFAKAVGIELEVISEEFNSYLDRVNKTRDVEFFVLGWISTVEPQTSVSLWSSEGGQNSTGYANTRVDELFERAGIIPGCDQNQRKQAYTEIQKLIAAEAPYVFLYEQELLSGVNKRLVVNKLTKSGVGYAPWEWYSSTGK